jgi:dTDP-4-dehydrorhamnose 3,5-epimerase
VRFTAAKLAGARVIQPQYYEGHRRLFARTYCARKFREQGWVDTFVQWNARTGTIRGLHYQDPPSAEVHLVRCTVGALLDVIVGLRPDSARICSTLLSSSPRRIDWPWRFPLNPLTKRSKLDAGLI